MGVPTLLLLLWLSLQTLLASALSGAATLLTSAGTVLAGANYIQTHPNADVEMTGPADVPQCHGSKVSRQP